LQQVSIFVLDEADRMLDMGFSHDVKKIIAKIPVKKQTLLFSATMPQQIKTIVDTILVNPIKVEVTPASSTVEVMEQLVYFVDKENKINLLTHLLMNKEFSSVLVFTRTKHGADRVVKKLLRSKIKAMAIHGNKSQGARQMALSGFKSGQIRVLVATDIAARGIDIDQLPYVINYDLPNSPETYVHRIGRTGRAGMEGTAISFCDSEEKPLLKDIQKLIGRSITETTNHPYPMSGIISPQKPQNIKKTTRKKI
jgi:ATP-dependent RNA helicase RhlE